MHLNSELLFRKYASPYFKDKYRVLEIAPSSFPSPYEKVVNNSSITWDTIDFYNTDYVDASAANNLTYELKSPYSFPVPDNSYDIILSGQVLEHVEKIWVWLKELKRVVKNGGKIITINPVSWPYHEAPIDCWRAYPAGITALAEEADLKVELALFESLEAAKIREKYPITPLIAGRSYAHAYTSKNMSMILKWNKLIRVVPRAGFFLQVPIEVAYDNISVLSK